ncbi:MAG: hypothetical protein WC601_10455 [Desulfotomaculaceae bacterium]
MNYRVLKGAVVHYFSEVITITYTPTIWLEHSMSAAQKLTALKNLECQAEEATTYMAAFQHIDIYTAAEANARYYRTASHPSGRSDTGAGCGVDAATVDGYTLAQLLALSVPAGLICMYGAGAVPAGYRVADGSSGEIDLQNMLVKGSGSGVAPGSTGGNNSVTPTASNFTTPDTTLADNAIPQHYHTYNDRQNNVILLGAYGGNGWKLTSEYSRTTATTEPYAVTTRTAHNHPGCSFTWTGYKDEAGNSQAGALNIRPACRAVRFLVRY